MTDRAIAIRAKGLSKVFGTRSVLDGIDLEVAEGETLALTGANGAGKTTLLRCLASLTRPTAGEVFWRGRRAAGDASARRLLGMVAHESSAYPQLTVRENLLFTARMQGLHRPVTRADEWIRSVGLETHAHSLVARISRGMKQRLALARALIHDPPILLLDEPFSGLDAGGRDWLVALLAGLRDRGRTVCFSTHDVYAAETLADRVVYLQSGRLKELGKDQLRASEASLSAARAA